MYWQLAKYRRATEVTNTQQRWQYICPRDQAQAKSVPKQPEPALLPTATAGSAWDWAHDLNMQQRQVRGGVGACDSLPTSRIHFLFAVVSRANQVSKLRLRIFANVALMPSSVT